MKKTNWVNTVSSGAQRFFVWILDPLPKLNHGYPIDDPVERNKRQQQPDFDP